MCVERDCQASDFQTVSKKEKTNVFSKNEEKEESLRNIGVVRTESVGNAWVR